jgi:hypothetical protein
MDLATTAIPVANMERFCVAALQKCGLSETDARVAADVPVTRW